MCSVWGGGERIGVELYQSWRNWGKVVCVLVAVVWVVLAQCVGGLSQSLGG